MSPNCHKKTTDTKINDHRFYIILTENVIHKLILNKSPKKKMFQLLSAPMIAKQLIPTKQLNKSRKKREPNIIFVVKSTTTIYQRLKLPFFPNSRKVLWMSFWVVMDKNAEGWFFFSYYMRIPLMTTEEEDGKWLFLSWFYGWEN